MLQLSPLVEVIPFEFFPVFDPKLIKNEFSFGETVVIENSNWNKIWHRFLVGILRNKILKINSPKEILVNDHIRGLGSGTIGKVSEKINVDSYYDIEADPLVIRGWGKDTGKLSVNEQRVIDSDYYQHFSYSLKSKIAYDTWNDIVSSMNHTCWIQKVLRSTS